MIAGDDGESDSEGSGLPEVPPPIPVTEPLYPREDGRLLSELSEEEAEQHREATRSLGYDAREQHYAEFLPHDPDETEAAREAAVPADVLDNDKWNELSPEGKIATMAKFQDFHHGIFGADDSQLNNLANHVDFMRRRHINTGTAFVEEFPDAGSPTRMMSLVEKAEVIRPLMHAVGEYKTEEELDDAISEVLQAVELTMPELVYPEAPGPDDDELLSQRMLAKEAASLADDGVVGEVKLQMLNAVGNNEHATHDHRIKMVGEMVSYLDPTSEQGDEMREYVRLAQATGLFDVEEDEEDLDLE